MKAKKLPQLEIGRSYRDIALTGIQFYSPTEKGYGIAYDLHNCVYYLFNPEMTLIDTLDTLGQIEFAAQGL
jgi:hypothetical protein